MTPSPISGRTIPFIYSIYLIGIVWIVVARPFTTGFGTPIDGRMVVLIRITSQSTRPWSRSTTSDTGRTPLSIHHHSVVPRRIVMTKNSPRPNCPDRTSRDIPSTTRSFSSTARRRCRQPDTGTGFRSSTNSAGIGTAETCSLKTKTSNKTVLKYFHPCRNQVVENWSVSVRLRVESDYLNTTRKRTQFGVRATLERRQSGDPGDHCRPRPQAVDILFLRECSAVRPDTLIFWTRSRNGRRLLMTEPLRSSL